MNEIELISFWKKEESVAHIHEWDFSHIDGRYTEETDLPWDYQSIILHYLKPEMKLLDVDTGGGGISVIASPSSYKHKCDRGIPSEYSAMQGNLASPRD